MRFILIRGGYAWMARPSDQLRNLAGWNSGIRRNTLSISWGGAAIRSSAFGAPAFGEPMPTLHGSNKTEGLARCAGVRDHHLPCDFCVWPFSSLSAMQRYV